MTKRLSLWAFLAVLIAVLVGCGGGGGGQSALPAGGSSSNNGTGGSSGGSSVARTLMWDAPTSNTDGSPVTDLAGYKIYYGAVSGKYTASKDVGDATSISVAALSSSVPAPGLYYIAVVAYDTAGNESTYSNEISLNL
jgi:uncharacterized protein YfaP (DUF2135 family)